MLGVIVVAIIGLGALLLRPSSESTSVSPPSVQGEVQKVSLGIKNANYYPNTLTVESGKPVELTLDSSVSGCFRSFTVKSLGVQEYSRTPAETISFVPTTKGTFAFACSMGMGYGKLIVK